MALKVEWTPEAVNTFDGIISYLESNWSEREVTKFIGRTQKVLQLISENPGLYRRSESKSIHEAVITKQKHLVLPGKGRKHTAADILGQPPGSQQTKRLTTPAPLGAEALCVGSL